MNVLGYAKFMLSPEDLARLLSSTESDRVKRTESTTNTDKFREAICAFSNDMPGHGKPGYLCWVCATMDPVARLFKRPINCNNSLRPIGTTDKCCRNPLWLFSGKSIL